MPPTSTLRSAVWNMFFLLVFLGLAVYGLWWLSAWGLLPTWVPVWDFLLMSLATFRLVRLFTYDLITQFARDWFLRFPHDSFFGTLGALLNCPWCTGLWFAGVVVFFYFATPIAWPIVLVLALAGVASFFQVLANLIGWTAEKKKHDCMHDIGVEHTHPSCSV